MNKKNLLKIFFLLLTILTFFFSISVYAESAATGEMFEVVPEGGTLPETAQWGFYFLVGLSGVAAFGMLVWAGFLYLTSAGNPSQITQAKDKGKSAIFGLIFILASYLILTTINPELTQFHTKVLDNQNDGIVLTNSEDKSWCFTGSISTISPNVALNEEGEPLSGSYTIQFLSPKEDLLGVYVYEGSSYTNGIDKTFYENSGGSFSISTDPGSIYFLWNKPGVYLYDNENMDQYPKYLTLGSESIGDFANKVDKIVIIEEEGKSFNAVLFSNTDYYGKYALIDSAPFPDGVSLSSTSIQDNNLESIFIYQPSFSGRTHLFPQINFQGSVCSLDSLGVISTDCETVKEDFEVHSFTVDPGTALLLSLSDQTPTSQTENLNPPGIAELFIANDTTCKISDIKTTQTYLEYDLCDEQGLSWMEGIPREALPNNFTCGESTIYPAIALPKSYIVIPFE
jgi:hypothetical protein